MTAARAFWVFLFALVAVAGYALATDTGPDAPRATAVGSTTNQVPPAPVELAPPYATRVNAAGCAQAASVVSQPGDGVLVVNAGTIQLRLADGPVPLPEWPLAPGSWVHFVLRAPGTYEVTGTRYTCAASGRPAPHFRLAITVP